MASAMATHAQCSSEEARDAVVAAAQPLKRWAKAARKVLLAAPSRIGLRRRNGETSPRRQHALQSRDVEHEEYRMNGPLFHCAPGYEVLGSRAGRTVWVAAGNSHVAVGAENSVTPGIRWFAVSLDRPGFVGSGQRAGREGREMSSFTSTLAILSRTVVTDQRATTPSRKQQAARRRMSTKRRPALPAFVNITLGASRGSGTRRSRASAPSHRRDSGC